MCRYVCAYVSTCCMYCVYVHMFAHVACTVSMCICLHMLYVLYLCAYVSTCCMYCIYVHMLAPGWHLESSSTTCLLVHWGWVSRLNQSLLVKLVSLVGFLRRASGFLSSAGITDFHEGLVISTVVLRPAACVTDALATEPFPSPFMII